MSEGWSEKSTRDITRENPLYLHRLLGMNPAFRRAWNRKLRLEQEKEGEL